MSHAAYLHRTAVLQQPDARGSMLGLGVSLLVHALVVAWLWHSWLPGRTETDAGPVGRIEVRLVPLAPPAPRHAPAPNAAVPRPSPIRTRGAPAPAPAPDAAPAQRKPRASAVAPAPTATDHALPADAANVAGNDAGTGTGTDTDTDTPTVDLAAARAAARLIARENGKALVTLPGRKPVVDPNADHHVVDPLERARRVDCQKARAESTNLLANVVMLAVDMAKNAVDDSGCKW